MSIVSGHGSDTLGRAMAQSVYLDHAATTPLDPRVLEAMLPYLNQGYGNPSSVYALARTARGAVESARRRVAAILGAEPQEVVFTSGGTESDNLALRGVVFAQSKRNSKLITSPIEHHAIGHTCTQMEAHRWCRVATVGVDANGLVSPDALGRLVDENSCLVSIMYANNEVGTIQPIAEIGRMARSKGVLFHTDAVQAGGYLDLNVNSLSVDLLSLSGHKFYGPKGVGVLYVRQGTPLSPMQTGGGQEGGLRSGTENVPGIVGLATALELAYGERTEAERLTVLRDHLISGILARVPTAQLTGHPSIRLPNNASFIFRGIDGEALVQRMDLVGIAASTGSACASADDGPSHVLTAMGYDAISARGSLRLTLGRETSREHVDYVVNRLPDIVQQLRQLSPLA